MSVGLEIEMLQAEVAQLNEKIDRVACSLDVKINNLNRTIEWVNEVTERMYTCLHNEEYSDHTKVEMVKMYLLQQMDLNEDPEIQLKLLQEYVLQQDTYFKDPLVHVPGVDERLSNFAVVFMNSPSYKVLGIGLMRIIVERGVGNVYSHTLEQFTMNVEQVSLCGKFSFPN